MIACCVARGRDEEERLLLEQALPPVQQVRLDIKSVVNMLNNDPNDKREFLATCKEEQKAEAASRAETNDIDVSLPS